MADIVRILGVSSKSTVSIAKSELGKFLSWEEKTLMSFKFKAGLDKVEGATPKGDPEGGPMTVESLFALYKE